MEGYSNYQQVIDAIKAEYVNARDLKRTATTKSRKTDTTGSFKKRKENEVKSLVEKSKSIDSLLDETLSKSVSDLNKSKFKDFKTKLSELKAKLEYIDSESKRFDLLNQIDPNGHKKATKTEEQTFSVVRNLLANAIKDCEEAISKIYDGKSYSDIVKSTKPNYMTHSEEEVENYYRNLESDYNQLFDKAKKAIDDYTVELFGQVEAIKQQHSRLIQQSAELDYFKNQLSKLLQNDAPQQELERMEKQIEDHKSKMLDGARDLKIMESARQEWINGKFHSVSEFIDDARDFKEEFHIFRQQNDSFLMRRPRPEGFTNNKTTELYDGLFQALYNSSYSGERENEFSLLYNGLSQGRDQIQWNQSELNYNSMKLYSAREPREMFDHKDGNENSYVTGFKKGISDEFKDFFVKCAKELQNVTVNYTEQHARYGAKRNRVKTSMWLLENERNNHNKYSDYLSQAQLTKLYTDDQYRRLERGNYDGTEEQRVTYQNAKQEYFYSDVDAEYSKNMAVTIGNKFSTLNKIFPYFYSNLDNAESVYNDAKNNYEAAKEQLEVKKVETQTAYDLLQTLTVGEAEYVAALADYEAKSINLQAQYDALNYISADAAIAYDFLQTTLGGENAYQSTVVSTQATIDQSNATIASELSIATTTEVTKSDAQATKSDAEATRSQAQSDSAQAQATIDQAEVSKSNAQATKAQAQATKSLAQSDKAAYIATAASIDQTILDGYDAIISDAQATIENANKSIDEAQMTIAQAQSDLTQSNSTIANAEATIANANNSIDEAQMTIDSALKNIADAQNTIVTANEELRQATDSHYIYLGAQSDYDSKIATRDAYQTNNVTPAQTAKDDAYTFFQNLTDEDAAYQNTLYDWTKKDTEANLFVEVVETARIAAEEKITDLENLKRQMYGVVYGDRREDQIQYEEILEFSGYTLYDAKSDFESSTEKAHNAQVNRENMRNAFEEAKKVMNWVESKQQDKIWALDFQPLMEKANDKVRDWSEILTANTGYLSSLSNDLINLISDVRNQPDFDSMLSNVKGFLEGYTQRGPGSYYEVCTNLAFTEFENRGLEYKMDFYKDYVKGLGLPGLINMMANQWEDQLERISSNDASEFQRALTEIMDRNLLRFPVSGFAWQIENEVNNGNPLVGGNN